MHTVTKRAGKEQLISNEIDFKTNVVIKDKGWHYVLIKGTIHQEDEIITNIYELNKRASKYMKKKLTELKEVIDICTVIADRNYPTSNNA